MTYIAEYYGRYYGRNVVGAPEQVSDVESQAAKSEFSISAKLSSSSSLIYNAECYGLYYGRNADEVSAPIEQGEHMHACSCH